MATIYKAYENQTERNITRELLSWSVEPQLALEDLREIKRRLEDGKQLKSDHVAYLIDAFKTITNEVRLTGDRPTNPKKIGVIVAGALCLTRRRGNRSRSRSFLSIATIYYEVKNRITAAYRVKNRTIVNPNKMSMRRACIEVAIKVTASGRKIGCREVEKIYYKQKKFLEVTVPQIMEHATKATVKVPP